MSKQQSNASHVAEVAITSAIIGGGIGFLGTLIITEDMKTAAIIGGAIAAIAGASGIRDARKGIQRREEQQADNNSFTAALERYQQAGGKVEKIILIDPRAV